MVLTACFALFPAIGLFCHRRFAKFIAKLDVSVETSSARLPKFAPCCSTFFNELRKAKGTCKSQISSAAFDLKFLFRTRYKLCRNFKSAALVPRDFAVRCLCRSSFDMAASTASRSQPS
jgi:hypothetical protein